MPIFAKALQQDLECTITAFQRMKAERDALQAQISQADAMIGRRAEERDALVAKLLIQVVAAEGLAEIVGDIQWVVMLDGYVRHCTEFKTGDFSVSHAFCHSCGEFIQNTIACRIQQALAAWRAES